MIKKKKEKERTADQNAQANKLGGDPNFEKFGDGTLNILQSCVHVCLNHFEALSVPYPTVCRC
jgi:hypothetical protein